MDSTELISRCKSGDYQALSLLYQQYKPRLLKICKQYAKKDNVAEDLLHDAFVIILTSLDRLETPEKLDSWMTSIVRNVGYHYRLRTDKEQAALQQMVSESREQNHSLQHAQSHAASPHDSLTPDYNQLQTLVSQLPRGYQQVFRLSVFEGLSHQEISQLLGISTHSSSSQLSHAKRMLRILIKQSWVLILLLIAIPVVIWKFMCEEEQEEPSRQLPVVSTSKHNPQSVQPLEKSDGKPEYVSFSNKQSSLPLRYQEESAILQDSILYNHIEDKNDTHPEASIEEEDFTRDTTIYQLPALLPTFDDTHLTTTVETKESSWNIGLTFNGTIGQQVNYLANTSIGQSSFDALSNVAIIEPYDDWMDYNNYLIMNRSIKWDAETRSIMKIAQENSLVNGGIMKASYEHRLPVNFQMLLSKELSPKLSIETGISYTQLSSTITTGSRKAYIQEKQQLHYIGIPLRLGWKWYSKAHLCLYSSTGVMLDIPLHSRLHVSHVSDGSVIFEKESTLDAPLQWSTTFGLGMQYDITPNLGVYLEPSLQYFFDDGSNIKTYRTEHPLQMTLPIGIRFHW